MLVIAGSDSGGGAGIQADIKTITAFGGFAATAVTAVTAQNSFGVTGMEELSAALVEKQICAVLDDIGADIVKTGMLGSAALIETVHTVLARYPDLPRVIDPVMVATSGARLLPVDAVAALGKHMLPGASVLTPNLPEAASLLAWGPITSIARMEEAGHALCAAGAHAVLVKGGHREGEDICDVLVDDAGRVRHFTGSRIATPHDHGTGCTLASAIAVQLAQGVALDCAVEQARLYVRDAMEAAMPFGKGASRPMNHAVWIRK